MATPEFYMSVNLVSETPRTANVPVYDKETIYDINNRCAEIFARDLGVGDEDTFKTTYLLQVRRVPLPETDLAKKHRGYSYFSYSS